MARILARNAPTMGVTKMNAKLMYGHNNTESYIAAKLSNDDNQQYLRRVQCKREAAGIDQKQREEEIRYEEQVVTEKKQKLADAECAKQEKEKKLTEELDNLVPVLDLEALRTDGRSVLEGKKLTIPQI